jgi:hypothetical protein
MEEIQLHLEHKT